MTGREHLLDILGAFAGCLAAFAGCIANMRWAEGGCARCIVGTRSTGYALDALGAWTGCTAACIGACVGCPGSMRWLQWKIS